MQVYFVNLNTLKKDLYQYNKMKNFRFFDLKKLRNQSNSKLFLNVRLVPVRHETRGRAVEGGIDKRKHSETRRLVSRVQERLSAQCVYYFYFQSMCRARRHDDELLAIVDQ